MKDPILIISPPRSGSSLVGMILNKSGVFGGIMKAGDRWNPKGYYENIAITNILVTYLRMNDSNSEGKRFNPTNLYSEFPKFRDIVIKIISNEGIGDTQEWFFKDPKLCFTWRLWHEQFPNAKWIVITRDRNEIINSFNRTEFMDAYSSRQEWEIYLNKIQENIDGVKENCNSFNIDIHDIFEANEAEIKRLYSFIGIPFCEAYAECVDIKLFNNDK